MDKMTEQRAIEILNKILKARAEDPRGKDNTDYAFELAVSALDYRIKKKPILNLNEYECPNCNTFIENSKLWFCDICGQALDWS